MANEVASIGLKMETDDVERGIKSLETLAQQGPKVEKAMAGVEGAAAKTGKSLKTIGEGAGKGLDEVGRSAPRAADGVGRVAKSAEDAKRALAGINTSVASLGQVSVAATQSAREMAGFSTSLQASQKSLIDLQAQARAAAQSVAQINSAFTAALPSIQAMAKAQAEAAKNAADMGRVFKETGERARGLGIGARASADAAKETGSAFSLAATGVKAFLGLQVVSWAKDATVALFEASAAAERLKIGLDFASAKGGASEIAYLRKMTTELGLAFGSTATAYMHFQAAAKGTTMEGDKARAVFESVAKASAVMGLSADQTSGVLLALQQMISKGTVQAEELRGQLGERLPGAFQIAAKAMGVTTAELGKMLEQGQVIADDFLPKFADALSKHLGDSAEKAAGRLDASVNNMVSSWGRLKQNVGDSGISQQMAQEMNFLSGHMAAVIDSMEGVKKSGGGMWEQLGSATLTAGARAAFGVAESSASILNYTINKLTGNIFDLNTSVSILPDTFRSSAEQVTILEGKVKDADAQLAHLQGLGGQFGKETWYANEVARAQAVASSYRIALAAKQSMMGEAGISAGAGRGNYQDPRSLGLGETAAEFNKREETKAANAKALQEMAMRSAGITKQYAADIKTLQDALKSGAIELPEYTARMSALATETWKSSAAGKEAAKTSKSGASAVKSEQSAYASLLASINEKISANAAEIDGAKKLTESQKLRIKLDEALESGSKKLTIVHRASLEARLAILDSQEREMAATRRNVASYLEQVEAQEQVDASFVAMSKAREAGRLVLDSYVTGIDESNAAIAMEAKLIGATSLQRAIAIEQYRVELDYKKQIAAIDVNAGYENDEQREIDRGKARLARDKALTQASTKAFNAEWQKTSDSINQSLTDALLRGFESGKDFVQSFRDTLINMFSTLVLRPVISAAVQPVAGAITSALGGSGQGGGGIGGAMQNANSLNNVWGAASQAISGGTAGASMASLGYANIVGAAGGDAIGALAAANGMWAGVATGAQAAAQAAVAANLALEAGTAVALEAGTLAAAGSGGAAAAGTAGISGALAAVPVWGWIALAGMAILSQMDLGSRGANHSGAAASSSGAGNNAAAEQIFGSTSGDWYGDVTQRYSAGMQGQLAGTVGALEGVYNSLTSYAGDTARKIDVLGAFVLNGVHEDEDAYGYGQIRDKLTGEILSSFTNRELGTDKEAAWTTYVGQMGGLIVEQLKASDIPGWMKQQLNTLGDDVTVEGLDAVLKQIATIDMGFKVLGQSMGMFNGMSAQTQTALLNISGGLEGLNTNAGTYYQGFYDEAERMDILSGNLRTALGGLDLSIDPAMGNEAKEQYRKAVENAFAAGNGDVAAKLLALSGNFASAADYAQKAAEESSQAIIQAAQESAQAAKELADNLRSSLIGLEGRFSGGGLSSQYQSEDAASVLQGLFAGMGTSKNAAELSQIILGATPAEIEQNFREMWNLLDTDEARQKLVDVTGAMLDLAGAADSAADASNALFNAIAAYRENLAGVIESAQLQTMTGQGRVDYLTGKESGLWAQLNTTDDPVAVAQKLQQTIIDRINAEADLRFKVDEITLQGLQSQLGVAEALKSAVSSMQSARDSLALGNDSPLNPYAQMQYAGGKFDDAYARALAGDMDAWKDVQSFGQSYVSLGRDNYASSAGSVDIYDRVTAAMDQLIGLGLDVDPQIAALNTLIELQQPTRDNTEQSVWIGQQQVDVLTRLDGVMQAQQSKAQEQGAQTIELLKEQNAKLQQNVEQQKAQMTQQSAMAAQSKEEMQLLRAEIVDLKAAVRGQAKAVTA